MHHHSTGGQKSSICRLDQLKMESRYTDTRPGYDPICMISSGKQLLYLRSHTRYLERFPEHLYHNFSQYPMVAE